MPLGTAQQTITTGANFIPEIWGPPTIVATEENLVLWNLIWDWTSSLEDGGDTVHAPNISNLTVNTKSANTQVTLNAPTEAMIDLLSQTHDECSFLIEDILKVQKSFNLMEMYTGKTAYAISRQADRSISDRVNALSQVVGAPGTAIGDVDIRDAIEFIDLANAPEEYRHLCIYPTEKNSLFGIEKYFRADFRGDGASKPLTKGRFGEIYGVDVYVTTNLGLTNGARHNTMFHKEAWAKANSQGLRTQGGYILEYLGNLVVSDHIYGSAESRDPFAVWLRS